MLLFIDRLPFYSWIEPAHSAGRPFVVPLPIIPAVVGRDVPPAVGRVQCWWVDTAFSGEALAWRHHLQEADPEILRYARRPKRLRCAFGPGVERPQCAADLWLYSNIPGLQDKPFKLPLDEGIAFHNIGSLPNPAKNCPVVGLQAFEESGVQVSIDFNTSTVSVWVPGSWYETLWHSLRRLLPGYAPIPIRWPR